MELRWGQACELTQVEGMAMITNGSWFDQSGEERAEGYLYRLGSNTHGVILFGEQLTPPKVDKTDEQGVTTRLGFSRAGHILVPLFPAWIGAELVAEVYGGQLSEMTFGNNNMGWVWEWGRNNSHNSEIWPNRSNTIVVKDWQEKPPAVKPVVAPSSQMARESIVNTAVEFERGRPQPLSRITMCRMIAAPGMTDHRWNSVRAEMAALVQKAMRLSAQKPPT